MNSEHLTFEQWLQQPVGLVCCGGGGKGAYQLGVFRALCEAGLSDCIKAVSGSSVGALNMALWALDRGGEVSKSIWNAIRPEDVLEIDDALLFNGKEGISSHAHLRALIEQVDLMQVSNSSLDLYATVSEYPTELSLDSEATVRYLRLNHRSPEEITNILLASSSMPVIYEPVRMNGLYYKDGGILDNTPIRPLYDAGIRYFIILPLHTRNVDYAASFPGAHFLTITPSKDLGDLFTGTLDFTSAGAKWRNDLGYMDAARTIRLYDNEDANEEEIKAIELRQFENTQKVNHALDQASSNLSKLDDLFSKYM
ncbi:MAG: patatin-like phospholipase family protein [Lachnospiraceae bacterium]|nr:patatin-like phospholipase family protein [Lachnospiraceae bacterium]